MTTLVWFEGKTTEWLKCVYKEGRGRGRLGCGCCLGQGHESNILCLTCSPHTCGWTDICRPFPLRLESKNEQSKPLAGRNPHSSSEHGGIAAYVFAEALAVFPAGEVEVAVQVEVVGREFGHAHDGLLTVLSDGVGTRLLLGFTHQALLQTRDHLALRVEILRGGGRHVHSEQGTTAHMWSNRLACISRARAVNLRTDADWTLPSNQLTAPLTIIHLS